MPPSGVFLFMPLCHPSLCHAYLGSYSFHASLVSHPPLMPPLGIILLSFAFSSPAPPWKSSIAMLSRIQVAIHEHSLAVVVVVVTIDAQAILVVLPSLSHGSLSCFFMPPLGVFSFSVLPHPGVIFFYASLGCLPFILFRESFQFAPCLPGESSFLCFPRKSSTSHASLRRHPAYPLPSHLSPLLEVLHRHAFQYEEVAVVAQGSLSHDVTYLMAVFLSSSCLPPGVMSVFVPPSGVNLFYASLGSHPFYASLRSYAMPP